LLWPYRCALLAVFALALVSAVLDLVWPLAIKRIVDGVLLAGNLSNSEKLRRLNLFGGAVVTLLVVKQAVDAPAPGTAQPCTCDACGRSTVRCARTAPTWTHGSGRRSAASGWCETVTHEILMERRGLYRDIVERQRHSFGDLAMIQE
jgi:hypothetical protein